MADSDKPTLIVPPNPLKMKVGIGGPGAVTPEALARAEAVIADMADDYVTWAKEDLVNLQAALAKLRATKGDNSAEVEAIFQIAHDVKGQGGSFGYPLMTEIGHHLCRFLESLESANAAEIDVIGVHIDALKLVITKKMKGDGGTTGDALFKGLESVVAKVGG